MNTQSTILRDQVILGILLVLLASVPSMAQDQAEDDKIWASFTAWIRMNPEKVSLRPGGILVFEHVLATEKQSFPANVHALPPNALLSHFKDFHIQKYEEGVWLGDWGGPPAELVRMIAQRKR